MTSATKWGKVRRYSWLTVAVILGTGCAGRPSRSAEDFRGLEHWLTCDECVHGERESVRRIGGGAVRRLDSALVGPSKERRDLMRAKLGDSYRFALMPRPDSNSYINRRLGNYIATYQKRAALSLGDIGTSAARDALDRAIRDSAARGYRPDVMRVIKTARTTVGASRFGGQIRPGQVSFGEIISVVATPGRHFGRQDYAAISDSPFPPNQIPFTLVGDTLRFFAVGDAGSHAIVVTDPQQKGGIAVGSVTITSLLDATDRAMLACAPAETACAVANAPRLLDTIAPAPSTGGVTTTCRAGGGACVVHLPRIMVARLGTSSPFAVFLALSRLPPRPDTVDFLKIEPPGSLPLTALLDWHGPANLDLAWRKCSPFVPAPNATVASFAAAESTSVVVPAGECWILQVSMGPGGDGPALARLRIRSP